ncbi:uncharacterized protein HD556DRAFT_1447617 [Suillus plorans]|uniref:KOW domain-containing protein n=1 Tax=Suillus plorans TaxID=116603 RepID=A0A9P7AI09_9AGAM|nr:uncharacterized protein HD556DRAFT_1447617 [Suillus plorans]KAG1788772.1 hypothetical protein HD556DRAFT_1447617 [Suillus plorans]
MPRGSQSLLDRSRLPNEDAVSDINHSEEVIGCKYNGKRYYMGLLLKKVHRDRLEHIVCPHADNIQLHLQSGWNQAFLKSTVLAFAKQFLHVGDRAMIIKGDLNSEIGRVVSTNHPASSVTLKLTLSGRPKEINFRLEEIERIFQVGDTVRVVAGPYLGVEGYIIQMTGDIFCLCQDVSKEELEVSKYYLDRRPLSHTPQARLPTQQLFNPPPDIESIQIGDSIDVLMGEHIGKSGIVHWLSKGGNYLWFQHESLNIPVPIKVVQRIFKPQTLQYMQDKGYNVKPGDVVRVARGSEYPVKGVIDHSLVHVPIGFVIKVYNVSLDSFKKDIGQEVFIIGGGRKGYRATLYSFNSTDCTVALHGQQRTKIQLKDVATRTRHVIFLRDAEKILLGPATEKRHPPPPEKVVSSSSASIANLSSITWTNWGASSEDLGMADNPSSLNPSQTADPWTVDINDMLDARTEKTEKSPLAWLMSKEFLSKFTTYHAMLKVSPSFMGGRLHNRFASMACPDPFLGQNGPASEGCVAVFCSSNTAGAAIQHYHIPTTDLSPAPPRKKNQQCIVLDGSYRGCIFNVAKCFLKKNTVDIAVTPSVFINLRFGQICLVEQSRITM